jgi:hypothetical protein
VEDLANSITSNETDSSVTEVDFFGEGDDKDDEDDDECE